MCRGFCAEARGAETFCEAHEVGVGQVRADDVAAELFLLCSFHVAVGVVIEDDVDQVQAVFHCGCQFRGLVHEAAVSAQCDDFFIGVRHLHAQGGGVAVTQVTLVAAADEMPRLVHREAVPGGIADLGDLIYQETVFRQLLPDHFQYFHLRPHVLLEFPEHGRLQVG